MAKGRVTIDILYFARVREAIGCHGERIDPPAEVIELAGLVRWLSSRGENYAAAFADPTRLRFAIDQRFSPADTPIAGAHEIAIFPPVTGG